MPVTRAPTACSARTNCRWLAGKHGSRKTTSGVMPGIYQTARLLWSGSMKLLFVSSEAAPFAKAGGLGDVASALCRQLGEAGHDVRLFLPLYARVLGKGYQFTEVLPALDFALGRHQVRVSIFRAPLPGTKVPVYFVR